MAHQTPFSFAIALGLASLHTSITVWYRLPILMTAVAMRPQDPAELNRMVSEKMTAATLGMIEGQKEMARWSLAAMTGRLGSQGGSRVVQASLRPALRTVKRNASRLARRNTSRSRRKG